MRRVIALSRFVMKQHIGYCPIKPNKVHVDAQQYIGLTR